MRAAIRSFSILTTALAVVASAPPARAEEREVTVDGEWSIVNDDVAAAKDKALDVALRRAVEQVSGTMVASETLVEDFQLKMDRILTQAKGFVKKYEIVEGKKDDNVYTVKIKAVVSDDKLQDEIVKAGLILQHLGRPRVMLLISEQNVGQATPSVGALASTDIRICENTIIDQLKPMEFSFVDYQALQGKITAQEALKVIEGANTEKIREIANLADAEVAIVGHCIAKDAGAIAGTQMHSAQANVSLRVFNTDNGAILATDDAHAASPHIDPTTGGTKALKQAMTKLSETLAKKLLAEWQRYVFGTRSIDLVVSKGASQKKMKAFESFLKYEIRGVQDASIRKVTYKKGTAQMSVAMKGTPQMLADELGEKTPKGVNVEVVEVTANKIEVELK
jgi:hypothetical protein